MKTVRDTLVPLIVSAVVSIGFVAFAGKAVLWTRFNALQVPPDQVVKAVPQSEAVAVGASILLLFGFFGAIATLLVYLVDRSGRATSGIGRALLALATLESAAAILIASEVSWSQKAVVAAPMFILSALAFAVTFAHRLINLKDTLPARPSETLEPDRSSNLLIDGAGRLRARVSRLLIVAGLLAIALALGAGLLFADLSTLLRVVVSFQIGGSLAAAALLYVPLRDEIHASMRAEARQEDALREDARRSGVPQDENLRIGKHRPYRFALNPIGACLMLILAVLAVLFPALVLHDWWFAISLGSAILLCFGLWRIAGLSKEQFVWFGFAVFLSVPLFGTLTLMARNLAHPEVQPMAMIRKTDGPNEAIQGLYVTEADERVYFATVATEGCSNHLTSDSGRLEWVPRSEVVAMSVGPLQSVEDAGKRALEMSYALTPAVETGSGVEAGLDLKGKRGKGKPSSTASTTLDKRLEHTGPAVRPNFGSGLSVSPESASPGKVVTLRMSAPNKDPEVAGFGATRGGRTLRVGGVRANILKEPARNTEGAEYLKAQGEFLRLAKGEPYAKEPDGAYVQEVDAGSEAEGPFLKLTDRRVLAVDAPEMKPREMTKGGVFLKLEPEHRSPRLAERYEVTLRAAGRAGALGDTERVLLGARPFGQAWHEREIKFEVPETAESGAVTVECSQLAGQPLLRVTHAPEARIWVRMHAGSNRVAFNGRRSTDADEETIARRWNVAGLRRGDLKWLSAGLPPRTGAYTVRLTVTDEGQSQDTAVLRVLRLPASLFERGRPQPRKGSLKAERRALARAMRREPPATIEIDGYAADSGAPARDASLSMRRAKSIRHDLLRRHLKGVTVGADIEVRMLGYGEGCPAPHSAHNHRVDVFLLGEGVAMAPPAGCRPRRLKRSEWHLQAADTNVLP